MATPEATVEPRKQRRENSDSINTLTRSQRFWLEDGNVVLQAGGTQFKVHRGTLCRHSDVFKDMFSMPSPPAEAEDDTRVEGCPVIQLHDPVKDVEQMLSALYGDRTYHDMMMSPAIDSIASMLRMGKKYAIAHLEAEAIGRPKNNYPQTLEDYDAAKMAGPKAHIFSFDTPNEIKALSLALEHNVQSVLPMMYFRCCEYLMHIIGEIPAQDGTVVRLPQAALETIIHGREKMERNQRDFVFYPLIDERNCGDRGCREAALLAIRDFWAQGFNPSNLLWTWEELQMFYDDTMGKWCEECFEEEKYHHTNARRDIWQRLPSFFGLPAWDQLKDG